MEDGKSLIIRCPILDDAVRFRTILSLAATTACFLDYS